MIPLNFNLVPSITSLLEQLDGQHPGASLYDLVEKSPFFPKPRTYEHDDSGTYRWLTYESRNGLFRYKTKIWPGKWSTGYESLRMMVPEPIFQDGQYTSDSDRNQCQSWITFKIRAHGTVFIDWDLKKGRHLVPLTEDFRLKKSRDHEWNYCWIKEDPKIFFDRNDFDEIWKTMQLLRVSIDRTGDEHRMRNKWWSRRTVSKKVFYLNLNHSEGQPLQDQNE